MASVTSLDGDLARLRKSKYTASAAAAVLSWLSNTLVLSPPLSTSVDLMDHLRSGELLCRLANHLLAATSPTSPPIRFKISSMPFVQMENISHFLAFVSREPVDLAPHDRFLTVDLFEKKDPAQVLQCLAAFSRVAHRIVPNAFPETVGGLKEGPASPPPPPPSPLPVVAKKSETVQWKPNSGVPVGPAEKNGTPAWNPVQYGFMGGASQGKMGISFGAPRQITQTPVGTGNGIDAESWRRQRETEQRERERFKRQEEEELEKTRRMQEAIRKREEEHRQRQEEDENRELSRQEELAQARRDKEAQAQARRDQEVEQETARLAAVHLEKDRRLAWQTRQKPSPYISPHAVKPPPTDTDAASTALQRERERVRELEKELQRAREREKLYEAEKEMRRREEVERNRFDAREVMRDRTGERAVSPQARHDTSIAADLPPRSLPTPPPRKLPHPPLPTRAYPPPAIQTMHRADSWEQGDDAKPLDSPTKATPPIEWRPPMSLLEKERERERQRQKEWEIEQRQTELRVKSAEGR